MKKILLFGAGKSATSLIRYLVDRTAREGWQLVVAENNLALAESKLGRAPHARAVQLDVTDEPACHALVTAADVVISLLPPSLHYRIALACLKHRKHLLTASYVDPYIQALEPAIKEKGLLFLCEMGLDPGIDHMSALHLIRKIRSEQGHIRSFRSHTGGLVAPESDNNPWHYKISWNPRNVVLAGSAGSAYRLNNQTIRLSYDRIFSQTGSVSLPGLGPLTWYPNRDSLAYIPLYELEEAETFIRTTLRYPGFCPAWSALVQAKLTDDQQPVHPAGLTYAAWSGPLRPFITSDNHAAFDFLGLFEDTPVPAEARTAADILQNLLEERLAMQPADRDMIVMVHEIGFVSEGKAFNAQSNLLLKGEDSLHTAMARTVGLPLGIAAALVLEGRLRLSGLHIPILPEIYDPVLEELEREGICFTHHVTPGS